MDAAAEDIPTTNGTAADPFISYRDLLTNALMGSRLVEIADVLLEHPMQMSLTPDEHLIQTLLPH